MILSTLLLLSSATTGALAYNNGVGKLPAMGYDTFNSFAADFNQTTAYAQAKAMSDLGLVKLGYNRYILDDFYSNTERNSR